MSRVDKILLLVFCLVLVSGVSALTADFSGNVTTGSVPLSVSFTDSSTDSPNNWSWFNGEGIYNESWYNITPTSGTWWGKRDSLKSVTYPDGTILVFGGANSTVVFNDTWRSTDYGQTWTLTNISSGWQPRQESTAVILSDNTVLIMGGTNLAATTRYNDVWKTTDKGNTWSLVNGSAGWATRYAAMSVVNRVDDSIILIGGATTSYQRDVWRSADKGVTWVQQTATAEMNVRRSMGLVSLRDGTLLSIGGQSTATTYWADIWKSTDNGASWTNITPTAAIFSKRSYIPTILMPDDSVVILGGKTGTTTKANDVWRSTTNGISWVQVNASAGWLGKLAHAGVLTNNGSILVMGGTETTASFVNNIWAFNPSSSTVQNPVHTYGTVGLYNVSLMASNMTATGVTTKIHYINVTAASADTTPPKSITGLSASLTDCNKTAFNWTNPIDTDYDGLQYYVNNSYIGTLTNASTSIYLTGLPESKAIVFSTHTFDLTGNVNSTWVNATANTDSCAVIPPADTTPPDSISNLVAATINDTNATLTWANPTQTDFYRSNFYRGDTWFSNYTNTTTDAYWCCLTPLTTYFVNTTTEDLSGNRNVTHWVNISFTTATPPPPTASFAATPTSGIAPLSVTFNDTSINAPTSWAYARNNLTVTAWELIASTRNATVSFPAGNWSVNLSASNAYGSNISTQETWVNVTNPIPVSAFSVNATVGITYGMHVAFTDLSTGSPTAWYWDFGDGGTSTLQNPTYIYDVSRLYNVSLKVTNVHGEYDWENKTDYINLQSDLPNVGAWSHFDGANGGTTFIDEIGSAISGSGATTSSTQIKFGNASLLTNTAGSYISTPNSTRNWFGNSAFTLEGWMYPTSTGAGNQLWQSKTNKFLSQGWGLYHGSASATSNDWRFFMGDSAVNSTDAFTIPLNTWTHVAIQRYTNGTVFIYLNGNYTTSKSMIGNYDTSNPYRIGRQDTGSVSNSFIGYTDEARGSNVVRWYANFTPPTEAYRDGQLNPDTNPLSTLRFKTDPVNTASITNQTGGGVRNRTIQIQNVNAVSYIVGSMTFDQEHLLVKNLYLNKTVWSDTTLVSSDIRNDLGYLEFNVSRAGGFSPDTTRSSFLDAEMLYWNYTPVGQTSSSFFGYGVVINQTTGTSYPIHNFIETVLTYKQWDFYPNFTADVTEGNAPLAVTFTDTTVGYPNRWDWDFGDGIRVNWTTQNPTHVYTTPGLRTVTLYETIWQNTSVVNSTTKIAYINVTTPPAPVASFTYIPVSGVEPLSVQFTDTSIYTPTSWGWFFQDKTGNDTIVQFSTSQSPLKIFNEGNFTIKLNATNANGSNVSTQISWVNVSAYVPPLVPPVAAFTANSTSICRNATVGFTDLSINTPLSWYWEFGEGNTSILQNPTREYFSLGTYTVNLRATNADGFDWENKTNYITVNDCTPIPPVLQCVDAAGNIPVLLSGSTYNSLNWTWQADDITKLSLDGVFLPADIDNSSPFLNTYGFSGDTWHMLKVYNVTDYGRLNCKTNASALGGQVDVYPVSQTPISPYLAAIGLIITGIVRLYIKRKEGL